jgi:gluconate 2-dehydrogenase gamma chain
LPTSRRDFLTLISAGGVGLLAFEWPGVSDGLEHAHAIQQGQAPPRFKVLTAAEAREISAVAARIMPTTDTPGATEAGAVYFFDYALGDFAKDAVTPLRGWLAELVTKAKAIRPAATRFSDLAAAEQDAVLKELEKGEFFGAVRGLTMLGMFSDPKYGGNRGQVGWKLLGFENRMTNSPPFGYYDAQAARGGR